MSVSIEDGILIECCDTNTRIVLEDIIGTNKLGDPVLLADPVNPQGSMLFLGVDKEKDLTETRKTIEREFRVFEKKTVYSQDKKVRGRKKKKDKEEEEEEEGL